MGLKGIRAFRGNKIQIRWQHEGKQFSKIVDKQPTTTNLKDAARERKRLIEATRLGELECPEQTLLPFEECCNRFLTYKSKTLAPSTMNAYRDKLALYWSELADRPISLITLAHLKQLDGARQWSSMKTRNHALSVLRGVFEHSIDLGLIEDNPAAKLKRGKVQKPEIDPFDKDEKEKVLAHLAEPYRTFYVLAFETGARTGEVLGLEWRDIKKDTLLVQRSLHRGHIGNVKTHQSREVYLTPRAKKTLANFTASKFKGGALFITKDGERYQSAQQFTEAFEKACKEGGVRYRRGYSTRHSYASMALTDGVAPAFIAKQLGDLVSTVLSNYARWIGGDADQIELDKMSLFKEQL